MKDSILFLKERLEIALNVSESDYREFKSAYEGRPDGKKARDLKDVGYDIAKTLVAFANAEGGELFVGIEDDCTVTGLPYSVDKNSFILQAPDTYIHKETPVPILNKAIIEYEGFKVAYFSVGKGSTGHAHITTKGECFKREGARSIPTPPKNITIQREEIISREYDRQFEQFANILDLDLDLIRYVIANGQGLPKNMLPEKFLQYLNLAVFGESDLRLRKAAVLLFAKNISKWHPWSRIRIMRVRGTEEKSGSAFNVDELADITDNIFNLMEKGWEEMRLHISEVRFTQDALFKKQIIYPELACKEALYNAIVHRDYNYEGRAIEIKIFDDRMEIKSPGRLLSNITIKDLQQQKGEHATRNTYIARVLREFGYIRELGEGIPRIYAEMRTSELVAPQFTTPNSSFMVSLFYKEIYTKEQKTWLSNFTHLTLSREQKLALCLGIDGKPFTTKELMKTLDITNVDDNRKIIDQFYILKIIKKIAKGKYQFIV